MTPSPRSYWLLAAIVALALAASWLIRFGTDDAFITFVYSRSLVRGDGLTWFGEHVEGYTNFAWTLWVALGLALDQDPLHWAWGGSLACLALAIVAGFRLATLHAQSSLAGLFVAGALATNFTFLAFGTSGLETMLQTALVTAAVLQTERLRTQAPPACTRLALWSLTCALALWTRLDSGVLVAVLGLAVVATLVRQRARLRSWLAATIPATTLVGGWLAWKLTYYGDIFPNTFHAKVGSVQAAIGHGAWFTGQFLHAYLLWPVLLAALAASWRLRPRSWLPHVALVAWLAYVTSVGGDFMEFRFFVPVLPLLFTVVAAPLVASVPALARLAPPLRVGALLAFLAAFSWRHAASFEAVPDRTYDSIHAMGTFYGLVPDGRDWGHVGRTLHDALAGTGATIATNGAGAIPYFADLPTVDQLGLNDPWVARNGVRPVNHPRPGHQRYAPYEYLVERKVTFVIGSPTRVPRGLLSATHIGLPRNAWLVAFLGSAARQVPEVNVVAAPLDAESALLLWYLTPSPAVTEAIQRAGWELRSLDRR